MHRPGRLKLFVLALGCWHALTLAFAADPSSLQIRWLIFSGRPDPTFTLIDPATIRKFVATVEALPLHPITDRNALMTPQLGYRGFHVTPTGMAGVSWFDVFGTAVAVASGGANGVPLSWTLKFDKEASLEQLLFQAARAESSLADFTALLPDSGSAPGSGGSDTSTPVLATHGASVAERSVTINLGAPIVSIVPIPSRSPVTTASGSRVKFVATQAEETASDVIWVKDSRALTATGRTFEIANATPADSGRYWAVVRLGNGQSTTSAQTDLLVTTRAGQRLLNLSVLGRIHPEQRVFTSGFTIEAGASSLRTLLLIRAVGPGLAPLGVNGPLRAPRLRVLDAAGSELAPANQPFALPTVAEASERVGAFGLPANSADIAQLHYLPAGAYTANVSASDATDTGAVLLEIFEVPLN